MNEAYANPAMPSNFDEDFFGRDRDSDQNTSKVVLPAGRAIKKGDLKFAACTLVPIVGEFLENQRLAIAAGEYSYGSLSSVHLSNDLAVSTEEEGMWRGEDVPVPSLVHSLVASVYSMHPRMYRRGSQYSGY